MSFFRKNSITSKKTFVFLVLLFCLFFLKGVVSLDPDFGWHLATGQIILEKGIPRTDPFSFTMPSYPYIDHAWLSDTFIAFLYPKVKMFGLAAIALFLTVLSFLFVHSLETIEPKKALSGKSSFANLFPASNRIFALFTSISFLFSLTILLPFILIRTQIITWFFWSILIRVLLDKKLWGKYKVFLPAFFLLWANLHGGFFLGLVAVLIVIVVKSWNEKKIHFQDFVLITLSILATLINPYKGGLWKELFLTLTSKLLRTEISEWLPIFLNPDLMVVFLLTLSLFFIFKYRKKYFPEEVVLYFFMLSQAILSVKHIPLWVFLAMPLTTKGFRFLLLEAKKYKYGRKRFEKLYLWTWMFSLTIFILQTILLVTTIDNLSEKKFYPSRALTYLRENSFGGEVFSEYGWGGYLIWKYPEKKVFIDGRMAVWRWKAPLEEESNVFENYIKIIRGDINYEEIFKKYDIRLVLWPRPKRGSFSEILNQKLANFLAKFGIEKKEFDFLKKLEEDNWVKVYEDEVAVVFKNPSR